MTIQILANGIVAASTIALVALGLSLIFRVTKVFHLAHALVISATAYLAYFLTKQAGWPLFAALVVSLIFGTGLGALVELWIYRPLRSRSATSLVCMVAALGILIVGQNMLSMLFGDQTKTLRSSHQQEVVQILGARLTEIQLLELGVATIVCCGVIYILRKSKFGKALRAIGSDWELSDAVGIPRNTVILCVFVIASALAGLAGLLIAYDLDISPNAGFDVLLLALTAAIIGGIRTDWGPLLGAGLVGCIQHLSGWCWPTHWQNAIVYSSLIIFLLIRPQGILGRPMTKVGN
ncbi:MAG: branched-chain amino acid ABC transporter permease [Verrucomicrobia bacterium]|nr:MAG: branched-chain amino acid ABC transporter permease [Verrucomicrobiota bacterium]